MRHEKKVLTEYFRRIADGSKTFELRLANWDCNEGDILVLREWDEALNDYTGRVLEKEVTFVGKTKNMQFWSQEDVDKFGYQIISFR